MSETTVKLWRCVKCRKWSFAKSRPKKHRRWVIEGEPEFDSQKITHGPYDDAIGGLPGHLVYCGPFEGWTARKDPT